MQTAGATFGHTDASTILKALMVKCVPRGKHIQLYCSIPVETKHMVITRQLDCTLLDAIFQLVDVAYVVYHDVEPYMIVQMWQPVINIANHGHRVNNFGIHARGDQFLVFEEEGKREDGKKNANKSKAELTTCAATLVPLSKALYWQLALVQGKGLQWGCASASGVSPTSAFKFLVSEHNIHLNADHYCFTDNGNCVFKFVPNS